MSAEDDRLAVLRSFGVIGARPEDAFDHVTALAADLFDTPIALLALVERDRVWFVSRVGVDTPSVPRADAIWSATVEPHSPAIMVVEDTLLDDETRDHPWVTGQPHVRFMAGAALTTPKGWRLGTLWVMDRSPRPGPTARDLDRLAALAKLAVDQLDLRRSREAAQAAAHAKSEFLANMSHEIRTPLNSIIGFTQVLKRDGSLSAMQLGQLSRVEEAGRSLLTLVNDVLELSKLDSGAVRLKKKPFSPAKLVRDVAALIRPQVVNKGLSLTVDTPTEASRSVIGDPDRLRQVMLNLLSNAVKFTSVGEVALRLRTEPAGQDMRLEIAVEDSGMGIPADQISRLFRRFAQADGSISRRFGGTGLGLAISKQLVEAMGGTIEVESTVKVGSRFLVKLDLPLAPEQAGAIAPVNVDDAAPSARAGALCGKRLLVAEDVTLNQKLVQLILGPLGCTIDFVADGAEALRAVQERDYALVLMDMQMPVLDGIETARAIRGLGGRHVDLPIVALSANVFPEQIARARAAGMNDFVTKPIASEDLIGAVLKWAAPSGDRPEPRQRPGSAG